MCKGIVLLLIIANMKSVWLRIRYGPTTKTVFECLTSIAILTSSILRGWGTRASKYEQVGEINGAYW